MTDLCKCPICGGSPSVIQYITSVEDRGWSVGCLRCNVSVTDEDKDNAIKVWNEVNSRECEPAPILKSCPFCGGTPKLESDSHRRDCCRDRFRIVCSSCYAGVRWYDSPDEAWLMWNGRVKE